MVALPIVLFIFISSNSPRGNYGDGGVGPAARGPAERRVVDDGNNPLVNDLTVSDIKFPDNVPGRKASDKKRVFFDEMLPEGKMTTEMTTGKTPVPLYSLVKNVCGEGYALDENGVCQKVITARGGKTFDADRKRRRKRSEPEFHITKDMAGEFGKILVECSKLYPGLVPDGAGGCTKLASFLEDSIHNLLPL